MEAKKACEYAQPSQFLQIITTNPPKRVTKKWTRIYRRLIQVDYNENMCGKIY